MGQVGSEGCKSGIGCGPKLVGVCRKHYTMYLYRC